MAGSTVGANLDESLQVHRDLAAQVALDLAPLVDDLSKSVHLLFAQVANARVGIDRGLCEDLLA